MDTEKKKTVVCSMQLSKDTHFVVHYISDVAYNNVEDEVGW